MRKNATNAVVTTSTNLDDLVVTIIRSEWCSLERGVVVAVRIISTESLTRSLWRWWWRRLVVDCRVVPP